MPQHVGRTHGAVKIDENIRKRPLEFDQAWRDPERSEPLGHCDPDFALDLWADEAAPGAHEVEGRVLHPLDRGHHCRSFIGQAGAVNVARE